mmetsp:Transcript_1238/g.3007  ORF Transcript_1238/g.3007 Transcript_1238/m.3007 type:complete len:690 (-) Transcript_1238:366-2435(-)|eukprot:CAMPEP_0171495568 /NCGR_PEP_ID=MMETSP0958-20121227/6214_1 /TAXON_ID=87120 /ORGANISM="Aurantiochytrium limacinum, Strain ATCCMYA-1381" /LENGTH=689 /DNA_ID=CAMNT_0012029565 /DNA_START=486 /DNA_END=2555 /DNA_ORIENTATION=-
MLSMRGMGDPPIKIDVNVPGSPASSNMEDGLSDHFSEDEEVARCLDWKSQFTVRGVLVGTIVGFAMTIISLKLSLTTGVIPSLNICAGLLGFVGVRSWVTLISKWVSSTYTFTRQENTVIQTLAVAQYSTAWILGFGSYYIAMDESSWEKTGANVNQKSEIVNPDYKNIIPFSILVCFTGIFVLNTLRKNFIVDMRLTYPSGTATAVMINQFFTDDGQALAHKQFIVFGRWFGISFFKDFFFWFFEGDGSCGISNFPTFGMKAFKWTWSFDFAINYVGVGMLCGHAVNYSMMVGAVIGWGIMWPIFTEKAGDWYPADAGSTSLNGILGYKVFLAIALIIGDGAYNIVKMCIISYKTFKNQRRDRPLEAEYANEEEEREDRLRHRVFLTDSVPWWVSLVGYCVFLILGCSIMPVIFPSTHWFILFVAYLLIPVFAPANAYICGLTDWDMSSTFGKLVIFIFAIWASRINSSTGIISGLATCGIVLAGTSQAATLIQDYKTGFLTRSSPRAMFFAQVLGTFLGCFLSPAAFFIFYNAFDVGNADGAYPAPYGEIYRAMAILGTEGFGSMPKNCPALMLGFFLASMVMNLARDLAPLCMGERTAAIVQFAIPIPGVMSIPFYISASLAIDMGVGSLVNLIWRYYSPDGFLTYYIPVASGLIAGDGIWALPSAILSLAGATSPICMSFTSNWN